MSCRKLLLNSHLIPLSVTVGWFMIWKVMKKQCNKNEERKNQKQLLK